MAHHVDGAEAAVRRTGGHPPAHPLGVAEAERYHAGGRDALAHGGDVLVAKLARRHQPNGIRHGHPLQPGTQEVGGIDVRYQVAVPDLQPRDLICVAKTGMRNRPAHHPLHAGEAQQHPARLLMHAEGRLRRFLRTVHGRRDNEKAVLANSANGDAGRSLVVAPRPGLCVLVSMIASSAATPR